MIILLAQERKYETKTFNETFAKKVRNVKLKLPYDIVPQAAMIKSQDQSNLKFNYFFFTAVTTPWEEHVIPQRTAVVENIKTFMN
jgi:hypothetical protein